MKGQQDINGSGVQQVCRPQNTGKNFKSFAHDEVKHALCEANDIECLIRFHFAEVRDK